MEAWFEAYAEAYTGIRLKIAIAPYVHRRGLEACRDAAKWWWAYSSALGARGGVAVGVASKAILLERAARLLHLWNHRAQFEKKAPAIMVQLTYGRIISAALAAWRESIRGPQEARAAMRRMMAEACEHHRQRVELPHAWREWLIHHAERIELNSIGQQVQLSSLLRSLLLWRANAVARLTASLPFVQAANKLFAYLLRVATREWARNAARMLKSRQVGEQVMVLRLCANVRLWRADAAQKGIRAAAARAVPAATKEEDGAGVPELGCAAFAQVTIISHQTRDERSSSSSKGAA